MKNNKQRKTIKRQRAYQANNVMKRLGLYISLLRRYSCTKNLKNAGRKNAFCFFITLNILHCRKKFRMYQVHNIRETSQRFF